MAKPDRQKFTAGMVLVLLGLGFFLVQRLDAVGSEVIMLIIGAAFLVTYFFQKAYGLLVPAGILIGIGVGKLLQDQYWWANEGVQLGLGVGFCRSTSSPSSTRARATGGRSSPASSW